MDNLGHRIDPTAKVESADHKFDSTAISKSKADGTDRIQWIELGGSTSKVVFE